MTHVDAISCAWKGSGRTYVVSARLGINIPKEPIPRPRCQDLMTLPHRDAIAGGAGELAAPPVHRSAPYTEINEITRQGLRKSTVQPGLDDALGRYSPAARPGLETVRAIPRGRRGRGRAR